MPEYDAIIVGAGPNGLAAAIVLAEAGCSVVILEAKATIGGGARTLELTLPGYLHDMCSAIYPLGSGSPFFGTLPLSQHGLDWIQPDLALAHPCDDSSAVILARTFEETGESLGRDAKAYRSLIEPFSSRWYDLAEDILGPLRFPRHPILMARFGLKALRSLRGLVESEFQESRARVLLAGITAHSLLPLEKRATASFGLVLAALGHVAGWPIPRGGSQQIVNALASYFTTLGGKIVTQTPVNSIDDLPTSDVVLFDVTPRQLLHIAGHKFPERFRRQLAKYRYGPGSFKIDWALDGPIPWTAPECRRAGTIHLGSSMEEISRSERLIWEGKVSETPFVIVAQQSLFDPTRAPQGKHTGWGYAHVPHGSSIDLTDRIEAQIERFAPGFRDLILERRVTAAVEMEQYNANYIGGDINGGVQDLGQLFTRPTWRLVPYSTPARNIYLCSSSTPPGGGVHGMCGYSAARAALSNWPS